MKLENFDLDKLYTFNITIYPEDKSKYSFQNGESSHDISGLLFADNHREAKEKLYNYIGVEYDKTINIPNIRHFVTEQMPFINENEMFCMEFSTHWE